MYWLIIDLIRMIMIAFIIVIGNDSPFAELVSICIFNVIYFLGLVIIRPFVEIPDKI